MSFSGDYFLICLCIMYSLGQESHSSTLGDVNLHDKMEQAFPLCFGITL